VAARRGEVYDARLDPTEGSEQAGRRPVIVVSNNAINRGGVVVIVPCTTYRGQPVYPSQVLLKSYEGGLDNDSVALCDQIRAVAVTRLERHRGVLSSGALTDIEDALLNTLDIS